MNREMAKELLPIIEAYANGTVIEVTSDHHRWDVIDNPSFNVGAEFYRERPEPREFWINTAMDTIARERPPLADDRQHWIKVVEVLD